jgi:hypothetical protein
MRILNTLILVVALTSAHAETAFESAMGEALTTYSEARNIEQLTASANQFQRIANAEPKEWLPKYYFALANIRLGFITGKDGAQCDAYLDIAQKSIDEMLIMQPNESEVFALQSMLHTARLVVDPMSRGQQMMVKSAQAYEKALQLNPNNPRAQYLKLSNEVGVAQFFGKDVAEYCPQIAELNSNFDVLNDVPNLYPSWGKREIEGMAKNCN